MEPKKIIITMMHKILDDSEKRKELVTNLQKYIWESSIINDQFYEIALDLAYDLEYYVPDSIIRSEDISYYGDERLEDEIKLTLKSLEGLQYVLR